MEQFNDELSEHCKGVGGMKIIEKGMMVMKGDMAWGVARVDGYGIEHGWVNPAHHTATIYNPEFYKSVQDVIFYSCGYEKELSKGKMVEVERVTTVNIL